MSMTQVHIVGTGPRTGTTLLVEAIRACCNVDFAPEEEVGLFARPPEPCSLYLTKNPGDLLVVSPSLYLDRRLHVVCMVRDPRDMVVSRHAGSDHRYYASLRYWKVLYPLAKRFRSHSRFTLLRYEDLVANPDGCQDLLTRSIPRLEARSRFSDFHTVAEPSISQKNALHSVRPIGTGSIGRWREHLPRVKQQVRMHGDISTDLIECGYEDDGRWLSLLEDVPDSDFETYWPEFFTEREIRDRKSGRIKEALRRMFVSRGSPNPS